MNKIYSLLSGIVVGIVNSLFGAGGGIIAVPILKKAGLEQKKAQASCLAVILPLTVISMILYLKKGYFNFNDGLRFLPFGLAGTVAGTLLMGKVSNRLLNVLFSALMIYSGIRLIL